MRAQRNRAITRRQFLAMAGGLAGSALLAACAQPAPAPTSPPPTAEVAGTEPTAATTAPTAAPAEKMTIRWMSDPYYTAAGVPDSPVQKVLEDRFGVKLDPVYIPGDQYTDKQRLMLASGDVPDMMVVYDSVDFQKFAGQGLLAETPIDLLKARMPKFFAMLNRLTPDIWFFTQLNGKNMGIRRLYIDGGWSCAPSWRADWLEKVGLEVPKTVDEFGEAFKRFVEQDPDGNGQKDTIGISAGKDGLGLQAFPEIYGAFGVIPGIWELEGGKVVFGATRPQCKEALKLLSRWYSEGIIDPEFMTRDDWQGANLWAAEKTGYQIYRWYFAYEPFPNSWAYKVRRTNPQAKTTIGPLPKGPGGQGSYRWGPYNNFIAFGSQLEKEPDKLAKILEILEGVAMDWDLAIRINWGVQGVHWEYNDPAVGADSGMKILPPYDEEEQRVKEGLAMDPFRDIFWGPSMEDDAFRAKPFGKEFVTLLGEYGAVPPFSDPIYDDAIRFSGLPSSAQLLPDLDGLWQQTFTEIIAGKKPVDAFDDYVEEYRQRGGEQLQKEANEFYAQMTSYKPS